MVANMKTNTAETFQRHYGYGIDQRIPQNQCLCMETWNLHNSLCKLCPNANEKIVWERAMVLCVFVAKKRPIMSEHELHCWENTRNKGFRFPSIGSEEELINTTGYYTLRRSQLVIHAIKARVRNKAWPLLPGECMSLKGQLLGINCDCDSAEWQQLCSISGGRAGAGRGGVGGSQMEGGRNWSEQCWVSGRPSNLRHLRAAWNMEAWFPGCGAQRCSKDGQGW